MSTSEFDRQPDRQAGDASLLLRQQLGLPEDFTEEDVAFAQELNTFFSLENEELPPYYIQTLLEAQDSRLKPIEEGLHYRTRARVFRRLHLRRRLVRPSGFSLFSFGVPPSVRQPLFALFAACLLFLLFTVLATGPSFASGLAILLSGKHSGVLQVNGYPATVQSHHSAPAVSSVKHMSLLEAQQQLHFSIYWPLAVPDRYSLSGISLYQSDDQSWADGPIMEMDYTAAHPGSNSHGTGQISVCEFKPKGQVLQVVQMGASHDVQDGHDSRVHAIYVDGQWVRLNKFSHGWLSGGRSEIIYERDGVVFWIVGDQRDGVDQDELFKIATSLHLFDARAMHLSSHLNEVTFSRDDTRWPFVDDVVYTDGLDGSSLTIVDANSPPPHTYSHVDVSP